MQSETEIVKTAIVKCAENGCSETLNLVECFYPDNDTNEPSEYYCVDHSPKHGFCWGCGLFWGGVESFEFAVSYGGVRGLCEHCSEDFKLEFEDDYDYYGELEDCFDDRFGYYGED